MFCTKCGKQLEDNTAFCIYCGSKIEPPAGSPPPTDYAAVQPPVGTPPPTDYAAVQPPVGGPPPMGPTAVQPQDVPGGVTTKKKVSAKILIPVILAAIVLIGVFVGYNLYNSPGAQMNRAIEAGNLEEAYEIFEDNFLPEDLSDHSAELLKTAATKIQDDYLAGSITYEEAAAGFRYIRMFGCDAVSETLSAASDSVQTHHQILTQLDAAETYYQNGLYTSAISAYEEILDLDPSNTDAASGLEKAQNAYFDSLFSQAEDYVAQGYFEDAIFIYQQVLSMDPSSTKATDGIEDAEDAYRDSIIELADEYASRGDFEGAVRVILSAMDYYFDDDAELSEAIDSLREREIEQMAENVYDAADGGDWDGALELLDGYQERYPSDKSLQELREDIIRKMPITLKNLTMVNSKSIEILTSVVSDRWGNIYDGAVRYDASNDAFCLYNLNKRYTTFTGTVYVPTSASNGKDMSFAVYLDEELVYYMDSITEETAPIVFELNVTGATTMRIVTDNTGSYSSGHLYFSNTSFTKVDA